VPSDGCLLVSADYCQLELRYLPQSNEVILGQATNAVLSKSKELTRGAPELVQHFPL
jgi:hypothetical protein